MSKKTPKKKPTKKHPPRAPLAGHGLSIRLSDAEHAALEKRADASMRSVKQQALWEMKQGSAPPAPPAPPKPPEET